MSEKLLAHLPALCNVIRRIAVAAGHATLEYYDEAGFIGADLKADGSPVTVADRAAEAVILRELRALLPSVPIISEEAAAAGDRPVVAGASYVWLVDPLDGTKEFVAGSPDYTVNIGLLRDGVPVLGVIYAPVRGELYAGCQGAPAVRWLEETGKEKELRVRRLPPGGLDVLVSRNHGDPVWQDNFLRDYKVASITKRGSALKFCAIAAGKADVYPRPGPTGLWDVAAGDAILRAAGGMVVDHDGNALSYQLSLGLECAPFIAASADFIELQRNR